MYSDDLDSVTNNLRDSAKGSNDGYDVAFPLTGYEPNDTELNDTELNDTVPSKFTDFQDSLARFTLSSDQNMDDVTLGKLLAEVQRDYADYRCPEGVCVRRQCLSWSIERRNLWKRVTSISFVSVSETCTVLTISFLQSLKLKGWSIERRNLWKKSLELLRSGKALVHRFGLCSMNKDELSSQSVARKFLISNSKQLEQNKNAKFYKKNYGVSNRTFVNFINKVLQRWRNYENSQVLPSIRSPDRSSSRIRTLFLNYLEDY